MVRKTFEKYHFSFSFEKAKHKKINVSLSVYSVYKITSVDETSELIFKEKIKDEEIDKIFKHDLFSFYDFNCNLSYLSPFWKSYEIEISPKSSINKYLKYLNLSNAKIIKLIKYFSINIYPKKELDKKIIYKIFNIFKNIFLNFYIEIGKKVIENSIRINSLIEILPDLSKIDDSFEECTITVFDDVDNDRKYLNVIFKSDKKINKYLFDSKKYPILKDLPFLGKNYYEKIKLKNGKIVSIEKYSNNKKFKKMIYLKKNYSYENEVSDMKKHYTINIHLKNKTLSEQIKDILYYISNSLKKIKKQDDRKFLELLKTLEKCKNKSWDMFLVS